VEGLDFRPDRDLLIGDSPEALAQAVVKLLDDRERQSDLGRNARRVSLAYDWRRLEAELSKFIEGMIAVRRRSAMVT